MKTIGHKLEKFAVTGVPPQSDAFFTITEESFPGKWKVIVFYPKDFTFVLRSNWFNSPISYPNDKLIWEYAKDEMAKNKNIIFFILETLLTHITINYLINKKIKDYIK